MLGRSAQRAHGHEEAALESDDGYEEEEGHGLKHLQRGRDKERVAVPKRPDQEAPERGRPRPRHCPNAIQGAPEAAILQVPRRESEKS